MISVREETHNIAVTIGKGENLRVTASRMFASLTDYIRAPGNGGAQQVIDAGYDPNVTGLWKMITADPSWPKELGTSLSTGKRLLGIGRAPEPEIADQQEREHQSDLRQRAPSSHLHNGSPGGTNCNSDIGEWYAPPHEVDHVEAILDRVKQLTMDELKNFLMKVGAYARSVGAAK